MCHSRNIRGMVRLKKKIGNQNEHMVKHQGHFYTICDAPKLGGPVENPSTRETPVDFG